MKLVIVFGPQAVGKMTVGQELEKITGLQLFHNHATIELVAPLFGYGSSSPVGSALVEQFRNAIFTHYAQSDKEGLIFTFVWAFNMQSDRDYIDQISAIFESNDGEVYLVELEANIEERLKRNTHEHRLHHKPSKRNIERSENDLKNSHEKCRLNSHKGEIQKKNYIRINNENKSPSEVAETIKREFNL